jgi:hypothetical protein
LNKAEQQNRKSHESTYLYKPIAVRINKNIKNFLHVAALTFPVLYIKSLLFLSSAQGANINNN